MKVSEIQEGADYLVHLSERTSMVYGGCDVRATVVRAGFHYVVETVTASGVRGAPFKRRRESEHANGVAVRWEQQPVVSNRRHTREETCHAGRAVVNSRNILGPPS